VCRETFHTIAEMAGVKRTPKTKGNRTGLNTPEGMPERSRT
jgi:hypothetical protein